MPVFAWQAVNARGRMVRGRMEAVDEADLHGRLRHANLHLFGAHAVKDGRDGAGTDRSWRHLLPGRRESARDLQQLFLHLERVLRAGVPLMTALGDIRSLTEPPRLRRVMEQVRRDVGAGVPLSEAFGRHQRVVGTATAPILRAGEESGHLTDALAHLCTHLRWTEDLGRRIRKALRYPVIVLGSALGSGLFLLAGVVPQLSLFFAQQNTELPVQTRALLAFGEGVAVGLPYGIGLLALAVGLFGPGAKWAPVGRLRDRVMLALPGVGPVLHRIALSRFAHFFAVLFRAGVPLSRCLETAGAVMGNRVLTESVEVIDSAVAAGSPLSDAMRFTGRFPTLVVRMVRVGEDTGDLAGALEHVSAFHDRDVEDATDRMVSLLEPVVMVIAGGVLAWMAWAVLLPILDGAVTLRI